MKHLLVCLLLALLAGCGGGGGSEPAPGISGPPVARGPLLVGYYGDADGQITETHGSTNVATVMGFGADGAVLRHAVEAASAGQQIMLAVCWRCGHDNMVWQFEQLRQAGALGSVTALYPEDEPDVSGLSDTDVAAMLAEVRAAAAGFEELAGVKYAVIYGSTGRTPGIAGFDLVGTDNYGQGVRPAVDLLKRLAPSQQLIVIAGGANPWREDPAPFVAYAKSEPRVAMLLWFIYVWPQAGQAPGIRDNGMRQRYCAAGQDALGRTPAC